VSFDKDALRAIDIERHQIWSDYYVARDSYEDQRAELRSTAEQRKIDLAARRAEYAAKQARDLAEWRVKKLAELATRKIAERAAALIKRLPSPANLSYPYASKVRPVSDDLEAVNSIVPRGVPGREDICQEIMLALLENVITLADVKSNAARLRSFVASFRKANFENSGYAISLDEPMRDGRSWHDVLVDECELEQRGEA
jgi:hypothetical protein